jgi:hypothetical protein
MLGSPDPDSNGDDGDGGPLQPVWGEVPREILELAENCRSYVLQAIGVELDYEPETLPILDEYLGRARTTLDERPDAARLSAVTAGAYFGEVVRRKLDGFWRKTGGAEADWQLCGRHALLALNPAGMVFESLALGADHEGPSAELVLAPDDKRAAESRLAEMPPVSEDEYFLLSTRLEVVETVHEMLRDQMRREGREAITFEESDYE